MLGRGLGGAVLVLWPRLAVPGQAAGRLLQCTQPAFEVPRPRPRRCSSIHTLKSEPQPQPEIRPFFVLGFGGETPCHTPES